MKTRSDAKRVLELCAKRESLHRTATAIGKAEEIGACADIKAGQFGMERLTQKFVFVHFAGDLRKLIKREVDKQIADIDTVIESLGVMPDKLDNDDIPFE